MYKNSELELLKINQKRLTSIELDGSKNRIDANRSGHNTAKILKKVLYSKAKKKGES